MAQKKVYDKEFKVQAVKLGREIGYSNAAKELGINVDTLYGCLIPIFTYKVLKQSHK